MPRAWTTWSSKEYLSKVPCTPPPPAPWGATHPGASHGRDRPTATWVPTMAVCPPVGRYVLTLSSPWKERLLRFRVVLRPLCSPSHVPWASYPRHPRLRGHPNLPEPGGLQHGARSSSQR